MSAHRRGERAALAVALAAVGTWGCAGARPQAEARVAAAPTENVVKAPTAQELRARAEAAARAGDLDFARDAYRAELALVPGDASARLALARLLRRQGAAGAEREYALAAAADPRGDLGLSATLELAGLDEEQGRAADAALALRVAAEARPERWELRTALALVLCHAGKLDEAGQVLRGILERHPRETDALRVLAQVEAARGRPQAAEWALARVRERDPKDAKVPNDLGVLALRRGDPTSARALFEQAVALDPGLAAAWLNLGALALSYRDAAAAARAYAKAAELQPSRWETRLAYGWALQGLPDAARARAEFDAVLALRPNQEDALFGRAQALRAQGDLAGARAAFVAYAALGKPSRLREAEAQIAAIDLRLRSAATIRSPADSEKARASAEGR